MMLAACHTQSSAVGGGAVWMTLVLLFAVSGFYHTNWPPELRMKLRRLDRSMIYLFLTAGSRLLYDHQSRAQQWVLPVVWTGAAGYRQILLLSALAPWLGFMSF